MKTPISWLKEFVDIDVTPEVLAENLVRLGFEVDEIIYQEKQVKNVVTVKILSVSKHPNADRLSVCEVDAGEHGVLQVVTNAKVEAGEYVPLALDGAVLSDGTVIKKGEVRGVLSNGMFCGGAELGITDDDYEGASRNDVLRLKGEFKTGESVLKAIGYDDVILDVSVTANRPDCNSVYKLAKEVALALGKEVKAPEIDYEIKAGGKVDDVVSVSVENSELCPRYMAAAVKNVKIFPSPKLIKKRLRAVGIRPINNIVDITNYVLIEIGQPMHAFDKRELSGDKIIVRCAKENEEIVTLDGKLNKLNPSMLVICNAEKPVAVAGIMGGEESGIKDDTAEVVLESARFKRDNVRRTSRALNLKSDSSSRFEKGVDFTCQELGLKRALTLIYKTGSGDIVDGVIDKCVPYEKQKKLFFKISKLDDILGVEVNKAELVKILNTIGIKSSEENG
ncbi:MAG: phenylalanine--tRNA ligase subunit beta, partial [Clostridiales bacterium]|nr:phenylalanine--tRNA ligase subunit beta [Clostridiales bacterium]